MIAIIRGLVIEKLAGTAIIDVGGVGYQLSMPTGACARLPAAGNEALVHTHMHVREDAIHLYGFSSAVEKTLFIQLIGVSNIGPKVALSVLSHMSAADLARAVTAGDADLIASVPGIGKKTAARLILELKDKLTGVAAANAAPDMTDGLLDAREALVGLGYSLQEANQALQECANGLQTEEYLKTALKKLGA